MSEDFEYFNHRCCMCPNIEKASAICPGIKGSVLHPEPSVCRFVKSYIDGDSKIFVGPVPSTEDNPKWAIIRSWPMPDGSKVYLPLITALTSFDSAQHSLNALAHEKGWQPLDEQRCRVCGCTDERACPGGCWWIENDLCSNCAKEAIKNTE